MNPSTITFSNTFPKNKEDIIPVSYTHLDVYKRQVLPRLVGIANTPNNVTAHPKNP